MKRCLIVILFLSIVCIDAQQFTDLCMNQYHSFHTVDIEKYTNKYDFSTLFIGANSKFQLGYIGDNYRRIRVKFLTAHQDNSHPSVYHIHGKTNVKDNICDFKGTLVIDSILVVDKPYWGVDNMYADSSIIEQGILIGHYELFEDSTQKHVGKFIGKVMYTWFSKQDGLIRYDDIESYSDGWCNSQFIGEWSPYTKTKNKVCTWGHGRLYDPHDKLDIGTGEFYPAKEYHFKGWESLVKAYGRSPSKEARIIENSSWWEN